jgi:AcrR family transcriptional regulator
MRMASTLSNVRTAQRRTPQQERGERRVAELLEAAASVMAERGYDAATMTEIAERANSSIGSLYQYFPNKEAVVQALRKKYVEELEERWVPLVAQASRMSLKQLVDRLFDMIIDYIEKRPAYLPLQGAAGGYRRDAASRDRLREQFAALFRERRPEMSKENAFRVANVTVQVLKAMNPLYVEAKGAEREEIVREFKSLLMGYLSSRLQA